jgi:hypothetical protein
VPLAVADPAVVDRIARPAASGRRTRPGPGRLVAALSKAAWIVNMPKTRRSPGWNVALSSRPPLRLARSMGCSSMNPLATRLAVDIEADEALPDIPRQRCEPSITKSGP